jgi:hypothetical protein
MESPLEETLKMSSALANPFEANRWTVMFP